MGFIYSWITDLSLAGVLEEFLRYFDHSAEDGAGPRQTADHINSLGLALAARQQVSEVPNLVQVVLLHDGLKVKQELVVVLGEILFLENLC